MKPWRLAVSLGVLAVSVEAGVTLSCPLGRLRVDLVQIGDHGFHRGVQAVEVKAVETDLGLARPFRVVVFRSQPTKSRTSALRHIQVGNRLNPSMASMASSVVAQAADVAVYAIGIGPVGLDGNGIEPLLRIDRLVICARSRRTRGAVRGLTDQDETGVADEFEQGIVIITASATGWAAIRTASSRHRGTSLVGLLQTWLLLLWHSGVRDAAVTTHNQGDGPR